MIVFALTLSGTALLCLSMRKHWKQLLVQHEYSTRIAYGLRAAGYLLLLLASIAAARNYGIGEGLTLFFGLLTAAIVGVAIALPSRRHG